MKKLATFVFLFVLSVGVVACGGSAEPEVAGPPPMTITVTGDDTFQFDPAEISVPNGALVTIEFVNQGTLEHSWVLTPVDVDPLTATEENAIGTATSGTVPPGESETFRFAAPEPGEYQIVCTVPGHAAGGMVGVLTVTP